MNTPSPSIIRRPDIGLAIAGTRITLYTIMEYLREGWSQQKMSDWLNLTTEQIQVAFDYIDAHRSEAEAEYDEVIREAEERRHYWEARLQEHHAHQPELQPSPDKAVLYAKTCRAARPNGLAFSGRSYQHVVKPPPFRCHCAAEFSSCATSEPAQGTFHRPAGGRHLSAARRLPAIPDRPAFPAMAHPRAA